MSNNKKPEPDFVVRLVAPRLKPWCVPMRSLARVLAAVTRLVEGSDDEVEQLDNPGAAGSGFDEPRSLNLLGVKQGSAVYAISARDRRAALAVIGDVGQQIDAPGKADWSDSTLSALRDLSEVARSLDCEIEICRISKGSHSDGVIARIAPDTYSNVSSSAFAYGETSVYARIERVGGAVEMHCGIRLPDAPRKMVICHVVGEELVRGLGQYLYQHVTLHGRATWVRRGWQLKHLEITAFEPEKTGSVLETLQRVREAGGSAWDDVADPDDYLAELRGE